MKKASASWGILVLAMGLSACGGGSSDSLEPSTQQPAKPEPVQSDAGKLMLINDDPDRPQLSVYDLNQHKIIDTEQLSVAPFAVYSSPNHRYGVLMNRVQNEVAFYDGLATEPTLLGFKLYGAAPTHFRSFNGQAAIFYDGHTDSTQSKFDVFTDADIATKNVASQILKFKHHGVAEPRGDYVLSSYLGDGETKLSMVKSYGQHGDHYHVSQTLTHPCSGLHGAASIASFTAFGCEDGMLLVEQTASGFKDEKLKTDVRIGTLVGHEKAKNLIGLSSASNDLFIVDPTTKSVLALAWAKQDLKRLKQAFSATAKYFVILDSTGSLTVLDTQTWKTMHEIAVFSQDDPQLTKAQLLMHGHADEVFISDLSNKTIYQYDLATAELKQTIQLHDAPAQMVWLRN